VVVSLYVYRPGTVDGSADLALMRRQLQTLSTQSWPSPSDSWPPESLPTA